jgi:hypothetical protein
MRITVPRLLVLTLLLIIGAGAAHKYAISCSIQNLATRLNDTHIDLNVEAVLLPDAVKKLHRQLAQKDSYFANCGFQVDASADSGTLVTLDLSDATGHECLQYVTSFTHAGFQIRPGTVIISHLHRPSDHRDPVERAIDSTVAWLRDVVKWTKHKLNLSPVPPPPDPFAPSEPDPKNPFGF